MLPVAPLMIEHRLIERMIKLMEMEVQKYKTNAAPDMEFIRIAIDFIRTYADKLHHGKEEDILFRDLSKENISAEHKRIMEELINEHVMGRGYVKTLVEARDRYLSGDKSALAVIEDTMATLAAFYPKHIEKEDKHFFLSVMNYFSPEKQQTMLDEFNDFDRKFIHRHYQEVVTRFDGKKNFPIR
jgi:hemerythrin-like domain-containing protein